MGDAETYAKICVAQSPAAAKALGRRVRDFDCELWDRVVCRVAYHAVYEKFSQSPELRETLLRTGDSLIAEATRNDRIWGIGIDVGDERVLEPSRWAGSNILGWALMSARGTLLA